MSFLVIAVLSLLLVALEACQKNLSQQILFLSVVGKSFRRKSENKIEIVYNNKLETQIGILEIETSAHSVPCTWHESLRHCSPFALMGCTACMSEEFVHNSCSFSRGLASPLDGGVEMRHELSTTGY